MTEQDQRIAIAEASGWTFLNRVVDRKTGISWDVYEKEHKRGSVMLNTLPDYLNDLNAMWDAEQQAGETVIKAMRFWLWKMTDQMTAYHATAAQHAEAFLRAMGRWKD